MAERVADIVTAKSEGDHIVSVDGEVGELEALARDGNSGGWDGCIRPDGSFVMPEAPFSIVDKTESLDREGFHRVLIDFSKTKVSRGELKLVKNAMLKKLPVPEASRFNWKDGFYNPERMEAYAASNERAAEERKAQQYGRAGGKNRNTDRASRNSRSVHRKPTKRKRG